VINASTPRRSDYLFAEPPVAALNTFPVRVIGRTEGLPSGQIHGLTVDSQAMVWFAGPNGLTKYDGTRMRVFTQTHGLTTHGLRTVAAAPDDAIWIGNDVGVDVIRGDVVHAMPDGWKWGLANLIVAESSGKIWLGAALGLISWEPGRGFEVDNDQRLRDGMVPILAIATDGSLWAVSKQHGLLRRQHDAWHAVEGVGPILTLARGPNATMFVGGEHFALQIDSLGHVQQRIPTPSGTVTAAWSNDDELWLGVGTELRHYRSHDGAWTFDQAVPITSRANSIRADADGNLWIATDTIGAMKLENLRAVMSCPDLGLGAVFSIRPTSAGAHLVAGERGAAIVKFGDMALHHPTTVAHLPGLAQAHAWDLIEDGNGELWAATPAGLQHHRADGTVHRVGVDHAVLGSPGRALLERADGLWVGTLNGLCVVNGDVIETRTPMDPQDGQSLGYVYSLVADGDAVWITTLGNGLWHDRGSGPRRCDGVGLSPTGNTYSIAIDERGVVAVSQDNRIVLIEADGTSRVLTEVGEALAGWAVAWGDHGTLWLGSSTGLCHYSAATGELLKQVTIWMGGNGWEFTTSRALLQDGQGRMLCGLDSGLAVIDLAEIEEAARWKVDVVLSSLMWTNADPEVVDDRIVVSEGKWQLAAEVYATWHVHEAHRSFRFRLLGFESGWSESVAVAAIRYSSLPAGTYTLQAQAHSPLVGWGPIASLVTVEVRPSQQQSPWQKWASYGSRRRLERLRQESHLLEQRVHERTVELSQATDQLASAHARERQFSSDVSHQLRTPLTRLRLRIENALLAQDSAELQAAVADLDHLDQTVHYLLAHARDSQPEAGAISLDRAVERAEERWSGLAAATGRTLVVRSGEHTKVLGSGVGVDQILDVLVHNAIVHGVGDVTVEVRDLFGGAAVDVSDEGSGLGTGDVGRIFRRGEGKGSGLGLSLARALAEGDGGRLVLKSRNPTTLSLVLLQPEDEALFGPG
jgi:signal transduction histidine kinase/ligand-binding sensor domain-containing protein